MYHPHPFFDEPSGNQAPFGEFTFTIQGASCCRLRRGIKDLWYRELHLKGHFHRLDGRLQFLILTEALQILSIQTSQQISLLALVELRKVGMFEVTQNGIRFHFRDIGVDAGISAWQKGIPPMGRFASGLGSRAHGHQTGQFLVFAAEPITQPGPQTGTAGLKVPQVEHHHGTRVLWNVRVHGVNKADVIHALSGLRKDVTHPLATPAILLETKRRRQKSVFGIPKRLSIDDFRPLTGMLGKKWFVIKGVHLGRASRHE